MITAQIGDFDIYKVKNQKFANLINIQKFVQTAHS